MIARIESFRKQKMSSESHIMVMYTNEALQFCSTIMVTTEDVDDVWCILKLQENILNVFTGKRKKID